MWIGSTHFFVFSWTKLRYPFPSYIYKTRVIDYKRCELLFLTLELLDDEMRMVRENRTLLLKYLILIIISTDFRQTKINIHDILPWIKIAE